MTGGTDEATRGDTGVKLFFVCPYCQRPGDRKLQCERQELFLECCGYRFGVRVELDQKGLNLAWKHAAQMRLERMLEQQVAERRGVVYALTPKGRQKLLELVNSKVLVYHCRHHNWVELEPVLPLDAEVDRAMVVYRYLVRAREERLRDLQSLIEQAEEVWVASDEDEHKFLQRLIVRSEH